MKETCVAFLKVENEEVLNKFGTVYKEYLSKSDTFNKQKDNNKNKECSDEEKKYFTTIKVIEEKLEKPIKKLIANSLFNSYKVDSVSPSKFLLDYLKNKEGAVFPDSLIDFDVNYKKSTDFKDKKDFNNFILKKLEANKGNALIAVLQLDI